VQEIADVYSRALFDVGKEHDKVDTLHEELDEFADCLSGNHELQMFFFSPYFTTREKLDGLDKVVEDPDEHFKSFLQLLVERGRMPAIFRIRREFNGLWREEHNMLSVSVTSAIELDDDTIGDIGKKVEEETGRNIELSSHVDPDLIGGLVIKVGNMVHDSSVRSRLERVRRRVAKAA